MRIIHVGRNGQNLGSFPEDQIPALVQSGQLYPTDQAWTEGMSQWVLLSNLVELPQGMGPIPPSLPSGPLGYAQYSPAYRAQTHTGRIGWKFTLITGIIWQICMILFIAVLGSVVENYVQQYYATQSANSQNSSTNSRPSPNGTSASNAGNRSPRAVNPRDLSSYASQDDILMLGICELAAFISAILAIIFLFIMYYACWKALPPQFRVISPGKAVGFLFIPVFNLVWMFLGIVKLCEGYQEWARSMGRPEFSNASGWGIGWGISMVAMILPFMLIANNSAPIVSAVIAGIIILMGCRFFAKIIRQAHTLHGVV